MTATVRAKFNCDSVTMLKASRPAPDSVYDPNRGHDKFEECIAFSVKMSPVYTGDKGENQKFWSATPCGTLEMQVMNQPAGEMFKPGKSYYLDFTLAD